MSPTNWTDARQDLAWNLTTDLPDFFRQYVGLDHTRYLEAKHLHDQPDSFKYDWRPFARFAEPIHSGQFDVLIAPLLSAATARNWEVRIELLGAQFSVRVIPPDGPIQEGAGPFLGEVLADAVLRAQKQGEADA